MTSAGGAAYRPIAQVPDATVEIGRVAHQRGYVPGGRNVKVRAAIERTLRRTVVVDFVVVEGGRLVVVLRWGVRVRLVDVHGVRAVKATWKRWCSGSAK